jgi:hypothetical protein
MRTRAPGASPHAGPLPQGEANRSQHSNFAKALDPERAADNSPLSRRVGEGRGEGSVLSFGIQGFKTTNPLQIPSLQTVAPGGNSVPVEDP